MKTSNETQNILGCGGLFSRPRRSHASNEDLAAESIVAFAGLLLSVKARL